MCININNSDYRFTRAPHLPAPYLYMPCAYTLPSYLVLVTFSLCHSLFTLFHIPIHCLLPYLPASCTFFCISYLPEFGFVYYCPALMCLSRACHSVHLVSTTIRVVDLRARACVWIAHFKRDTHDTWLVSRRYAHNILTTAHDALLLTVAYRVYISTAPVRHVTTMPALARCNARSV